MCVCALQSLEIKYSVFYNICVLMFMYCYTVCYFTCIIYAVLRQISMLFIDNKDSVYISYIIIIIMAKISDRV